MIEYKAEQKFRWVCRLGEGPVWDRIGDRYLQVDIEGRTIHQVASDGSHTTLLTPSRPGAVVVADDGKLVAALEDGLYLQTDPEWERLVVLDKDRTTRMNDAKVDPAGRLLIGSMGLMAEPGAGTLYSVAANVPTALVSELEISNGLAWSSDHKKMFFIDTRTNRVDVFDYDIDRGAVSNRRTHIDTTSIQGSPDGMTIDAEDHLWVCFWGGSAVHRFNPSGEHVATVHVGAFRVTSCTFGGPDLEELFITTARVGMSKEELGENPEAGTTFSVAPGVQGTESVRYKLPREPEC